MPAPDLRTLAGAVLCVGIPGPGLDAAEREALADLGAAGVILFARNVSTLERTRELVAASRDAIGGDVPALVGVDQEGGRVLRLHFVPDAMPSMLALGASGDETLARRAGARLGRELRAIGANVDFAPVLDVLCEAGSTVTGTRSLGTDPALVARMGTAVALGLQGEGVVAVPKHFPGHGATTADSHVTLPVLDADLATLRARELVPFAAAIASGVRALMSAHVVVPALDPERPATLSPAVLSGLLRSEMGFRGVCFTDCLQMDAVAKGTGTARGAVLALAAGADVALISHDLPVAREARDAIVRAVEAGALPLERVREAAQRVRELRTWAHGARGAVEPEPDEVAREVARRGVVRVRGSDGVDAGLPVTVISFEGDASDGIARSAAQRPSLALALRRRRVRAESMRVPLDPDDATTGYLLDIVAAHGARPLIVLARRAYRHAGQRRALAALFEAAPRAIAIAALEPFDVPHLGAARTVLCTHGDDEPSIAALAAELTGAGPRA